MKTNNLENFNFSFFGSSSFSVEILEDIHNSCGLSLGVIAKKQFESFKINHKNFLKVAPDFWNSLELNSSIWNSEYLNKIIQLPIVVTKPEKLNGEKIVKNSVTDYCHRKNIEYFSPEKISTQMNEFNKYLSQIDLVITASFGQLIPVKALEITKYGYLNWHPSNLPLYRGSSPVQSAIFAGDRVTGLSWIEMTEGMDAGDIYFQDEVIITKDENFYDVIKKMSILGSHTWAMVAASRVLDLHNHENRELVTTFTPARQDYDQVTMTTKISKDIKNLNPEKLSATHIYNHYRAYIDFPGTWVKINYFKDFVRLNGVVGVFGEDRIKNLRIGSSSFNHIEDLYIIKTNKKQQVFLKCGIDYLEISKICLSTGKSIDFTGYNFN